MIGKTFKNYRLEELLGKGGMGTVYRARDTRLDRLVAFKVLSEEYTTDGDRRRRFLQEARAACAVNHPAIAQIYDADEAEGVTFIAMELVEGRTVRRLVQDRELDVLGAVEIATQIGEGLAKAHEAGIVHRDIKSDNVMVTNDGHAKILDFGLAKLDAGDGGGGDGDPEATILRTVERTQQGMVVGTIGYMSPEQARGRDVDPRSDIFSLGIVVYEMVTGELPFRGDSPLDTLHAIAFEESAPVTSIRTNLPPSLQRVVNRCLRKRPEDRYQSASEFVRDMKRVRHDIESGVSRRLPLGDRLRDGVDSLRRMAPRQWIVPAIVGVAAVLLLVLILVRGASGAGGGDFFGPLFTFGLIGLLVWRRLRNRRWRLVRGFAKKAAKMEEVRLVSMRGDDVTVLVTGAKAKTYLRLNAMIDRVNGKLFFGEPFRLDLRDGISDEDLKSIVAAPGLAYVHDEVELPS